MNAEEYFAKWALIVKETSTNQGTRYDVEDFTFYRYRKNRHPEQPVEWLQYARRYLRNEAESNYYAKRRRTKDPRTPQGIEISLEQHEKNRLQTASDYISSYQWHASHVCHWWSRICSVFRRDIIGDPNVMILYSFGPEPATVRCLEKFGWDGRVWPIDEGWPEGSEEDEKQIITLMEQGNVRATLTFPPGEQGFSAQPVSVQRAKGPFLMPPLEDDGVEPQESNVKKLRQLCENPKLFHRPVKPARVSIEDDPEGTRKLVQRMMGTKTRRIVRSLKAACKRSQVEIKGLSKRKDELAPLIWWSFKDTPEVRKKFEEAAALLKAEPEKLLVEGLVVAAEVLESKLQDDHV